MKQLNKFLEEVLGKSFDYDKVSRYSMRRSN